MGYAKSIFKKIQIQYIFWKNLPVDGVYFYRKNGSRKILIISNSYDFVCMSILLIALNFIVMIYYSNIGVYIAIFVLFITSVFFLLNTKNTIYWDKNSIIQNKYIFYRRLVRWDEIKLMNINSPKDRIMFFDGRATVEFTIRPSRGDDEIEIEPTYEAIRGASALARYARMRLRHKPDVHWRAS